MHRIILFIPIDLEEKPTWYENANLFIIKKNYMGKYKRNFL